MAAATASANAAAAAKANWAKQRSEIYGDLPAPDGDQWNNDDDLTILEAGDPTKMDDCSYPEYSWIDITKEFFDSCSSK